LSEPQIYPDFVLNNPVNPLIRAICGSDNLFFGIVNEDRHCGLDLQSHFVETHNYASLLYLQGIAGQARNDDYCKCNV